MKDMVGMAVEYSNCRNTVLSNGIVKEYPIGGMICDYLQFSPKELKRLLAEMPMRSDADSVEKRDEALMWLYNETLDTYGVVAASMLLVDLSNFLLDISPNDLQKAETAIALANVFFSEEIKSSVFSDTPYVDFGRTDIRQAFLFAYATYLQQYALIYTTVHEYIDSNNDIDLIATFFEDNTQYQDILYRIVLYDGGFHSVYGIKSGMALALFEMAHLSQEKKTIKCCKNCGKLFVPFGRADVKYCGYQLNHNSAVTCRELASRSVKTRMQKNDIVAQEYRRLYMRYQMATKRHPGDKLIASRFAELRRAMSEKRQLRDAGKLSSDDLLEWLASMDTENGE